MSARQRHPGAVLLGAAVVFVGGLLYGFQLLTASADTADPGPTCESRTVAAGDDLTSNLVTVDVLNASERSGLANRVSINLQRRGFLAGTIGNSKSARVPRRAGILTQDRSDPRVRLVAAQLGGDDVVQYAEPDIPISDEHVTVLVGDDFKKLAKAKTKITTDRPITVCVPIVEVP